jgi:flagellar biosynthesis protein FlhG
MMVGQTKRLLELKKKIEDSNQNLIQNSGTPVISFTSGKGGTGKTFISLNIAYQLSKLNKKILVVDFDLNFSNIQIMLNAIPSKTLYDFFTSQSMLDELIYNYGKNLDCIFGYSGFEQKRIVDNGIRYFWNQLISIAKKYDYILIDTSSGANENVLEILSLSDYNIVVANPEPTATLDAYAIIKLINISKTENIVKVIINKYFREEDALFAFNNLTKALKHFLEKEVSLLGYIPFDKEITRSIMDQELYLEKHTSGHVVNRILSITEELINIKQVANNNHP